MDIGVLHALPPSTNADGQAGVGELVKNVSGCTRVIVPKERESVLMEVSSGYRHTIVVRSGKMYASGIAKHGRLGLPEKEARIVYTMKHIPMTVNIRTVSCGFGHTAAICYGGLLYCWGFAENGALGLGEGVVDAVHTPQKVERLTECEQVSCGGAQTLVLLKMGELFVAGDKDALGAKMAGHSFKKLDKSFGKISLIEAGNKGCIVVSQDRPRDIIVFGSNETGALGCPPSSEPRDPEYVKVGTSGKIVQACCTQFAALLDETGSVFVSGSVIGSKNEWTKLKTKHKVKSIAGSVLMLMYLEQDGLIYFLNNVKSAPSLVSAPKAERIFSGYRTFFMSEANPVTVTNKDYMSKLRGKCKKCAACFRYACAQELMLNSSDACYRCGCPATGHGIREEPLNLVSVVSGDSKSGIEMVQAQWKTFTVQDVSQLKCFAVSDIHTDFRGNMIWLEEFVKWADGRYREDIIIVAGDISHDFGIIETTFTLLQQAFGYVFHICGNHELWVAPQTDTIRDGYDKLYEIQKMCIKLGVHCYPVSFEDKKGGKPLIVFPILSWYEPQFVGSESRGHMKGFDMACRWEEKDNEIASRLLSYNVRNIKAFQKKYELDKCHVITFSHFIPRPELFFGWPALAEVMGSKKIDEQLRQLRSTIHVFGHSHMNCNTKIDGVQYIQYALGSEAYQRKKSSFPRYKPLLLTPSTP